MAEIEWSLTIIKGLFFLNFITVINFSEKKGNESSKDFNLERLREVTYDRLNETFAILGEMAKVRKRKRNGRKFNLLKIGWL